MALIHHWKLNNNLQDAVGDMHLSNVVDTPVYGNNKDGIANSATTQNLTWSAYSSDTLLENSKKSVSVWLKKSSDNSGTTIFSDGIHEYRYISGAMGMIQCSDLLNYGRSNTAYDQLLEINFDEWFNLIFVIDYTGYTKFFVNGVLKRIFSNSWTNYGANKRVSVNGCWDRFGIFQKNGNSSDSDEIKLFDHILTDGGVTTTGQTASLNSEVWQLYLAGVNNIPAYTMNPATDIAGTSARLTWSES